MRLLAASCFILASASLACAQPAPPIAEQLTFWQKTTEIAQRDRNAAQDRALGAEARASMLEAQIAALKAQIAELEAKVVGSK